MQGSILKTSETLAIKSKSMPIYVSTKEMEIAIEMNILTKNYTMKDMQWNAQMLGWTVIDHFSIDSIPQLKAGKDSTTCLLL